MPSLYLALLLGLLLAGCRGDAPEATALPGGPVPGLSPADQQRFQDGRALFNRDFTEAEGLGPLFNQRRCSGCHDLPTLGGMGAENVRKVTRFAAGKCDLLVEQGGDMVQAAVTELLRARGTTAEPMPRGNASAFIVPPALYGLGLVEAIPEALLLAQADPDDRDGDGISGRAGTTRDGTFARFGRKGNFHTLRAFVEDALAGEMGITSPAHPAEETIGGQPLPEGADPAADPELDSARVTLLTDYVRFLAAPAPDSVPAVAWDSVRRGERAFRAIGCAACHTPRFNTSPTAHTALARRSIALYSDMLLHDMGSEFASICNAAATPSEWRTTPLLGVRYRFRFLHDGRAESIQRAIELHGGEAERAKMLFLGLPVAEQEMLLRFLRSL